MAQVVTRENMAELLENGSVPEFVAPGTEPVAEVKPNSGEEAAKTEAVADPPKAEETKAEEPALPDEVQKRINAKHRQMKEAEEFAKSQYLEKLAAEKRVEELERENAELKKSSAPAPEEEAKPPKQEDFATVQEYLDAAVTYNVEAKLKERERLSGEKAAADAAAALAAEHEKRFKAAAERIPDLEEVVGKADFNLRMPLYQYIRESETGPELAYHIAKNPDIAERLNRLSPIKALAELGKIEVALAKAPEAPKPAQSQPEVSKAPAPIKPLSGNSEPVHKEPKDMTFKELRAHNEQQRRLKAQKR